MNNQQKKIEKPAPLTPEQQKERHRVFLCNLLADMKNGTNPIWPELQNWDYKGAYAMDPVDFKQKNLERFESPYFTERLFEYAAMQGASHDELIRILKFLLIILDSRKYFLDVMKAKYDLGIKSLAKKYMDEVKRNG
jgi:hypothetical protein